MTLLGPLFRRRPTAFTCLDLPVTSKIEHCWRQADLSRSLGLEAGGTELFLPGAVCSRETSP